MQLKVQARRGWEILCGGKVTGSWLVSLGTELRSFDRAICALNG